MGDASLSGTRGGSGNARANIPDATKECDKGSESKFSRILLKCIPGMKSVRRLASSDTLEMTKRPYLHRSLLYVHCKLSSEYCQKRRLHIQNRFGGCVLQRTNPSKTAQGTFDTQTKTKFICFEYFPSV